MVSDPREEKTMADKIPSHPQWATTLERSRKRQITNGAEGLRFQEQIFKAIDDFYNFLDRH
jgi:hypothetical protein